MNGEYIVRFVQAHETFRRPELEALARYENVDVFVKDYQEDSPYCIVRLNGLSADTNVQIAATTARSFISRSILSKGIFELWGSGADYESLHANVQSRTRHLWDTYRTCSFKFTIDAVFGKRSTVEQRRIIDSFSYLAFKGKIAMKDPEVEFVVMEEWSDTSGPAFSQYRQHVENQTVPVRSPKRIFLGRLIGTSRRALVDKHDLKKRPYISTTSMDAELALVTANLALAGPGKLFLDPFVGTGGFMVAASELGAISLGSDIDGRSFRGKGAGMEKGVCLNFSKYGLQSLFGDCIISDLTNTPLTIAEHAHSNGKRRRWLDGIISDPPYGVREGLKVLGIRSKVVRAMKSNTETPAMDTDTEIIKTDGTTIPLSQTNHDDAATRPLQPHLINGIPAHTLPDYIAPKKPYSFAAMLNDILEFAAQTLVDHGRLAFWMPSANEESNAPEPEPNSNTNTNDNIDPHATETTLTPTDSTPIPTHPRLRLIHVCTQSFNRWSRRLLVYERVSDSESHCCAGTHELRVQGQDQSQGQGMSADDLNPFRRMYFRGFQT